MSTGLLIVATLAVFLGATATYLLLPHRHGLTKPGVAHLVGAGLASAALLLLWTTWTPPRGVLNGLFFYVFASAAVGGGLMTITSRDPIHSALWFASVVLATSGLFLLAGGPFLAAGTIIVYAGAIVVTFLFVIMLAQMEGRAEYDRSARAPASATITCFVLLWSLLYALGPIQIDRAAATSDGETQAYAERQLVRGENLASFYKVPSRNPASTPLRQTLRPSSALRDAAGREKPSVAGIGESIYTDHLLTVELAGTLLFVALVAAVVITNPRVPGRTPQSLTQSDRRG